MVCLFEDLEMVLDAGGDELLVLLVGGVVPKVFGTNTVEEHKGVQEYSEAEHPEESGF